MALLVWSWHPACRARLPGHQGGGSGQRFRPECLAVLPSAQGQGARALCGGTAHWRGCVKQQALLDRDALKQSLVASPGSWAASLGHRRTTVAVATYPRCPGGPRQPEVSRTTLTLQASRCTWWCCGCSVLRLPCLCHRATGAQIGWYLAPVASAPDFRQWGWLAYPALSLWAGRGAGFPCRPIRMRSRSLRGPQGGVT